VQAGQPLPEVAALAAHPDIKMTLRYAHLAPSHLRAGIQALEQRGLGQLTAPALSTELCVTLVSRSFTGNALVMVVPTGFEPVFNHGHVFAKCFNMLNDFNF
jgi:hypothetical protein